MAQQAIFEAELAPIFIDKAPFHLPTNLKEIIVQYGPYVALILLPLKILIALLFGGIAMLAAIMLHPLTSISLLVSLGSLGLGIIAIPGLFKRTRNSWMLLYWAQLLSCLSALINLQIIVLLLTFLIGFYLLFQMRSYYTN